MKFSSVRYALVSLMLVAPLLLWVQAQSADNNPLIQTLIGHSSGVGFAIFSPDNTKIVTTSYDNTAKIWDTSSGRLLNTLSNHWSWVISAAFSPDGTKIVTTSYDQTVKVWDTSSGRLLNTLTGYTDAVFSAAFSPDGTKLVAASRDGTAKVWDTSSGRLLNTLSGHSRGIFTAKFSPDGAKIVTASWDKTAKVWDATSGRLLNTLSGHTDEVRNAEFSPDGTKIVTASFDTTAKVWDVASGRLLDTLSSHTDKINSAFFSPDGTKIVTASSDKTAKVWDVASGRLLNTLLGHSNGLPYAIFSPDGTKIVTASWDNTARVWNASGERLLNTLNGHAFSIWSVAFSPDGTKIVTTSSDKTAKVWNVMSFLLSKLTLTTQLPGTQVLEKEKLLGVLPLELYNLSLGRRTLTFSLDGYQSQTLYFDLKPGDTFSKDITLQPLPSPVRLTSSLTDVQVKENDRVLGTLPLELNTLSLGKHRFTLEREGYATQTLEIDLKPGETLARDITLQPLFGTLQLSSTPPGAQVARAGVTLGVTPLMLENQSSGVQNYTLNLAGYQPLTRAFEVVLGKVLEQSVSLERVPAVVQLSSSTPGVLLSVDGKLLGPLEQNATLRRAQDRVTLEFSAPFYLPQTRTVTLDFSAPTRLDLSLERARSRFTLSSTPPGAQVLEGGQVLGLTPLTLPAHPQGPARFELRLDRYRNAALELTLDVASLTREVKLERRPSVLTLTLEPKVEAAVLKLDGVSRGFVRDGQATLELAPDARSAEVQVVAEGRKPYRATIALTPSGQTALTVVLEPRDPAKPVTAPLTGAEVRPTPLPAPSAPPLSTLTASSSAAPVAPLTPRTEVFALVIGVGTYSSPDIPALKYAVSDAERFAALLRDPALGNLPPQNVRVLSDRQARRFQIERTYAEMAGALKPDQTLIVYFSGHGSSSAGGEPLLAPWDAEPEALDQTLLPLQKLLGSGKAGRTLVILDACYSGLVGSKSVRASGSRPIGVQTRDPLPGARVSVLSASSAREASFESDELKAGFFTAYLLRGLAGEADADGDGNVTLTEAFTYTQKKVSAAVLSARNATQVPQLFGGGDFVLAQNPGRASASLRDQRRLKLGRLRAAGQLSGPQLDALLDLLERAQLPQDALDYLAGTLDENRFVRRVRAGGVPGVPTQ